MKKIKWGIIGLGKIAGKFAGDLQKVEEAILYGVASRNMEKAEEFKEDFHAEKAFGSYEAILKDEEVDVIYVATPHVYHAEITKDCLHHGKAVLCEKPFAMNRSQVEEMIALAKEKNIFLMEALWTKFLPHFKAVEETIKTGKYGKIKAIKADFGFKADYNPEKRLFNKDLGGGSLLDIGIYPVFLAHHFLGMPDSVQAEAIIGKTGVDERCDIRFHYNNGTSAELFSTLQEDSGTTAEIELENGKITMHSRFHEPTSAQFEIDGKMEIRNYGVTTKGYNFEAEHVTKMLQQGKKESDIMSFQDSLELISLLDSIREKIDLQY
ncbi:MAG: Gfo/Idh/MocA family oxidoreductase [Bacteroidota bacterium]|nr:Gfo/Idh/MocA family oxidoreductase [Bacteroidota bacterium]